MTFGSLFAGIGGIDLGLERAGWECRWQIEREPYCLKVLEKHWPHVKRYGDITTVSGSELEPVDCLAGGFPCQDLSQAGKRAGIEGSRSGLWAEFARIIGELRPRYVLVENVPGLLTASGAMGRVVGDLAGLGYVGCWRCLRAADFGASHLRKRVFLVAYRERIGSERRGDAGSVASSQAAQSGEGLQRQRNGNPADDSCDNVAYCPPGGRGVLRQPSGGDGFIDGRDEPVAYAEHAGSSCAGATRVRQAETDHALRRSREMAHAERAERGAHVEHNGQARRRQQTPDRSGSIGGLLANPGRAGERRPAEQAGLDRRRASGDDCGAGGALDHAQCAGLEERDGQRKQLLQQDAQLVAAGLPFAPGPADPRWPAILRARPDLAPALESPLRGVADGVPDWLERALSDRTKRLGRLGNAVVPDCVEWIGRVMEHLR